MEDRQGSVLITHPEYDDSVMRNEWVWFEKSSKSSRFFMNFHLLLTFFSSVGLVQASRIFVFNNNIQPISLGNSLVGGGAAASVSGKLFTHFPNHLFHMKFSRLGNANARRN
jgi:hypothetical protein